MAPKKQDLTAQCDALVALLGASRVYYPASIASYFSPQAAAIQPACFVQPATVQDVAVIIKSLTSPDNGGPHDFAIRAGGHTWFADANSSPNGVTIDIRELGDINVSNDHSTVSVGAGATWGAVYGQLDALGLSVAGGRVGNVGVGGLTLGGGISYFGPREGWTSNQAVAFEVVLADGRIVEATEKENSDLWWALRGGSNEKKLTQHLCGYQNFGVVTRIDFRTFKQGQLWYAMKFNPLSVVDQQIAIYANLMSPENYNANASYLTGWAYAATQGLSVSLNQLIYTKPQPNSSTAPAYFQPVLDLPAIPVPGLDGDIVANMSTLAAKSASIQAPQAAQYMTATVTFEPTEAMIKEAYVAFNKSLPQVQHVTGISWALNLEPLPPHIYEAQGGSGANALGLTDQGGRSLVVCLISPSWSDAAQNDQVYVAAKALMDDISARAKRLDVHDPYIYLNYAAPWQDVISSYGAASVARLRQVRAKYDPDRVFTKQVAGGFKIPIGQAAT
ncbi:putative oxidoreductase [Xylariaceae sp. FL1272]|nr:putative oxidoreductase [Xylariaceae sp. FL1272]